MTHSEQELFAGFVEEVQGYLPLLAQGVDTLRQSGPNTDVLSEVHRLVHSMKGAASMVGFAELSELAHETEESLEQIAAGKLPWTGEAVSSLGVRVAQMRELVEAFRMATIAGTDEADGPSVEEEAIPADAVEIDPEILDAFRAESDEHLQAIAEQLPALEERPGNKPLLQSIRRSVHTLKGASGMVGLRSVMKLAHRMEDVLDLLYEGGLAPHPDIFVLLSNSFDRLQQMLHGPSGTDHKVALDSLYAGYAQVLSRASTSTGAAAPAEPEQNSSDEGFEQAEQKPESEARRGQQFVRVPVAVLDDLVKLVSELVLNRTGFEQHLGRYAASLGEMEKSFERLNKLSNKLDTDYEVLALRAMGLRGHASSSTQTAAQDFDELEFDRYTEFHLLSRDLTETISDLTTAGNQLDLLSGEFTHYLKRLGRLTTDVQDKLLRVRLVPLTTVLARLQRTVKVTAQQAGKAVDLVVDGEQVELDKIMLEELVGPIEHLLRNCVDHGIEPASARLQAGKPERGTISLRAYQEGTQVVLQIGDDGKGMDPEKIRAAVTRLGFLTAEEAAELNEEDLFECVFQPGFSTAERVSEISGRGIGMDVVKSVVREWKGTIQLESILGQGTLFTIRLPLTLASTRVMLVKAASETYAVPLDMIIQTHVATPAEFTDRGGRRVWTRQGDVLPVFSLNEQLGFSCSTPPAGQTPVLVLRVGERRLALVVDQLLEAREVVVKSLTGLIRRVKGVMGATLMGDGGVVLIVDPTGFLQEGRITDVLRAATVAPTQQRPWHVLIVDDSLSVRRVLTNFVKSQGWEPVIARDGQEALEYLQQADRQPECMLLDVEMPRMDGYSLLRALRAEERFADLPIVMLTSRSSEKHRKKAFEAGATDYLVKPYNEKTLIQTVKRVVQEAREMTAV